MLKKIFSQLIQFILIISTLLFVVSCTSTHKTEDSVNRKTLCVIDQYRIQIACKIQNNWAFPDHLTEDRSDIQTLLVFKVMPNGEIKDLFFTKRSGNNDFDESAYKAIMKSNPVDPHPKSISEPYVTMGLRFTPECVP